MEKGSKVSLGIGLVAWRNDIRFGREEEGDSGSTLAKHRALDKEEKWRKAVR